MREPLKTPNWKIDGITGEIAESYIQSDLSKMRQAVITDYFQQRGSDKLDEDALKQYDHGNINQNDLEQKLEPFFADLYNYVIETREEIQRNYEPDRELREAQKPKTLLEEFDGEKSINDWLDIAPTEENLYFTIKTGLGRVYTEKIGHRESERYIEELASEGETFVLTQLLDRLNTNENLDLLDRYSEIIAEKDPQALIDAIDWPEDRDISEFDKAGWNIMLEKVYNVETLEDMDENDII